ncbi:MAG TPA: 3-methyladenine DNA glycosylase [Mycobacteriales bacterium]|nr:3-methyladenine DNA glycosylase [Mycobacteriales bacterium]
MLVLSETEWQERAAEHGRRADALVRAHVERRKHGRPHPVEDFLFTYYQLRPAQLRRWHPGAGVILAGESARERLDWRWYVETADGVAVDADAFRAARAEGIEYIRAVLEGTLERPGQFGCFGLHEWAMVYRQDPEQIRHHAVPLRLGSAGTDRVVESHRIRCSHFDAFRFFTDAAAPRNEVQPSRAAAPALEQPGCLHAGMDCYRWAMKLGPLVPGELLLACFELARDIRSLDMRASPYDLSGWGYRPVRIETAEGKAEYVAAQRGFAGRAEPLRRSLLEILSA